MLRLPLSIQILIAIGLAILVGLFFGELVWWLGLIGDAYVLLLKMSILPYIVAALIHGIGHLHVHEAARLLKLSILFLVAIWIIVVVTLLGLAMAFPSHQPAYYYAQRAMGEASIADYIQFFIPGNPFFALANNVVPAVVVFCLFFGAALMFVKRELKEPFLLWLETGIQILSRITGWVIRLSPIGVFALVGNTLGTVSFLQLQKLGLYLVAFCIAALFFTFWALPTLVTAFTRIRYRDLLKNLQPAIVLAFAAGNIFVALPTIMSSLDELAKKYGFISDDSRKVAKTLVPIAYNLPLVGNLMAMFFVLFLSSYYAIDFSIPEKVHLIIASLLTLAGPVTAGLNSISFLVEALRLPNQAVSLFAETFSITRNLQGLAGAMGVGAFSILAVSAFTRNLHFRIGRFLLFLVVGVGLVIGVVLLGLLIEPTTPREQPPFEQLTIASPVATKVYRPGDPLDAVPLREKGVPLFQQIQASGVLRVGYNPNTIPFAYFNERNELVGYDIALAYDLAQAFDWNLEFIPFDYPQLAQQLQEGRIDMAVSAVSVTSDRLQKMAFASPSAEIELVFIVPVEDRLKYASLPKVQDRADLTLGILNGSAFIESARKRFPQAQLVELASYDEFLNHPEIDALLWTNKEGLAWVLLHRGYTIVEPLPRMDKGYYAFAFALGSEELIEQVNYWLKLRTLDGTLTAAQEHWIEGKSPKQTGRWSIIRDVLHLRS